MLLNPPQGWARGPSTLVTLVIFFHHAIRLMIPRDIIWVFVAFALAFSFLRKEPDLFQAPIIGFASAIYIL